jgi:23S rRNA U2552 (ribose-2'-O)-methylase RlmE/FtsJ
MSYPKPSPFLSEKPDKVLMCEGTGGPPTRPLKRWTRAPVAGKDGTHFRSLESRALQQCKNDIQKESQWDDFKKITNPYEYVFLSWNRRSSRSVSTYQPLSRSYFKMIEMWFVANLTNALKSLVEADGGLATAHSAEGPGGFIEACWEHAKKQKWSVKNSFAITLRSEARNVPGWRKAVRFLAERPQIEISDGADGTGNILIAENQDAFVTHVRTLYPEGVHIYTSDGGFDFSSDYNAQEDVIFPLLLAESIIGLRVLKRGGCFVLKCFDTTERPTLDLLWMLSQSFREWKIVKPYTSRAGNAERYFVGIGFVGDVDDVLGVMQSVMTAEEWNKQILTTEGEEWREWRDKVLHLQEQIEGMEYVTIKQTLNLIHCHDFSKIRNHVRDNVQRSMRWCKDYDEPISHLWTNDFDRNISRETQDLLNILTADPDTSVSANSGASTYNSWYSKPVNARSGVGTSTLSFEGFRSSRNLNPGESLNPFMRYSGTLFRN